MAEKPIIVIKKKKGGGHGGGHGGAWKVAYADFVTAMMCFFLVMWLMGADDETKKAIEHYFNHPDTPYRQGRDPSSDVIRPLGDNNAEGESILNGLEGLQPDDLVQASVPTPKQQQSTQHEELAELAQEQMENQGFNFDVQVDYLKFSLPESLFFRPNEHTLSADASKYLIRLGQIIRGYRGFVSVAAHVDENPGASRKVAYDFSTARAVSVMNYLIEKNYIGDERISALGRGSASPVSFGSNPDARARNRRMEFTLSLEKQR